MGGVGWWGVWLVTSPEAKFLFPFLLGPGLWTGTWPRVCQLVPRGLGMTLKCCRPPTTTHHNHPITFEYEGEVPQKNLKKYLYLSVKKSWWTARGRTWSGSPCSVRTSSILLVAPCVAPLSKCQHPGQTNSVQKGPNAGLPCR